MTVTNMTPHVDPRNGSMATPHVPLPSVAHEILLGLLVITCGVSLLANLTVIIIITCIAKLRNSLSFLYILCLCSLGLVAAGSVLPYSLAVLTSRHWPGDQATCTANGYFNAFLMFAVILTTCVIDLEKYYCIKFPMHHAGHMSMLLAILSIAVTWIVSLVFAAVPLAIEGGYSFRPRALQCTFLWQTRPAGVVFSCFTTIVVFCVPALLMLYINSSMYRIAKRAMRQVEPLSPIVGKLAKSQVRLSIIVTGTHGETSRAFSNSPELTTSITTTTGYTGSRNNSAFVADEARASSDSENQFNIHAEAINRIQQLQGVAKRSRDIKSIRQSLASRRRLLRPSTNYKALKNLVIPFVYFFFVWGSFFIVHTTWVFKVLATQRDNGNYVKHVTLFPQRDIAETVCTLLTYISYALNPFVYGFMNKTFRDECVLVIQDKLCRSRDQHPASPSPPPCEDFMEFLARTSYSGQGQSQGQCQNSEQHRQTTLENGLAIPCVTDRRHTLPSVED